jgi:hypothetical protein
VDPSSPSLSEDEVKNLFSEHRDFLISQMFKMGGWRRMGIYQYLRNEHPVGGQSTYILLLPVHTLTIDLGRLFSHRKTGKRAR